ncbi:hypothetical protein C8035_v002676 [Colletotrichum spinosum]|uniref:Uncharacterized protein n=1 Tax=Colletotrichum spinosum TaxID=1347390 RepID=A0A4R8PXL2_9PEZI|nr:hypothetical protein C8035_v002676 [Colletotrichum spinosum]
MDVSWHVDIYTSLSLQPSLLSTRPRAITTTAISRFPTSWLHGICPTRQAPPLCAKKRTPPSPPLERPALVIYPSSHLSVLPCPTPTGVLTR